MAEFYLKSGEQILVDDDVFALIDGQTWSRDTNGTVGHSSWENGRPKRITLHRLISEHLGEKVPRGQVWIHLDGNWRNFQVENLRLAPRGTWLQKDQAQAAEWRKKGGQAAAQVNRKPLGAAEDGTKRYRGVHKSGNKFKSLATVNGKQTYLGLFATPEEAARAYDAALVKQGLEPVNVPSGESPQEQQARIRAVYAKKKEIEEARERLEALQAELAALQ